MTCLIVDDEPVAREILEGYVADTPGLTLLASCSSGISALKFLKKEQPDLLFLDIKMPGLSGMELLRTLEKPPAVILTTAYPDYALEGYELSVTDYLLKPFSFERFLKAVHKAEKKLNNSSEAGNVLMIRADKKTWPLKTDDILLVESAGDYITIHTEERKITAHGTMKQIEDQLSSNFLRVHKSWIVSKSAIEYLEGNILLVHGVQVPIGKTYRELVRDWMQGT